MTASAAPDVDGTPTAAYREARDQLLALRGRHREAVETWRRPDVGGRFNWAVDWFDAVAAGNDRPALMVVEEDGGRTEATWAGMSRRSNQVARWLVSLSTRRSSIRSTGRGA